MRDKFEKNHCLLSEKNVIRINIMLFYFTMKEHVTFLFELSLALIYCTQLAFAVLAS